MGSEVRSHHCGTEVAKQPCLDSAAALGSLCSRDSAFLVFSICLGAGFVFFRGVSCQFVDRGFTLTWRRRSTNTRNITNSPHATGERQGRAD